MASAAKAAANLQAVYNESSDWGQATDWSLEQYDTAYQALRAAEKNGVPEGKEWQQLSQSVQKYEKTEAKRRADKLREDQRAVMNKRSKAKNDSLRGLRESKETFETNRNAQWTRAVLDTSLNGPVLSKEIPNSKFAEEDDPTDDFIEAIIAQVEACEYVAKALPENDRLLQDEEVEDLLQNVEELGRIVQDFEILCQTEVSRRESIEGALVRAEQEKVATEKLKKKLAGKKVENTIDKEAKRAREAEAERIKSHDQLLKKSEEIKRQRREQQKKMMAGLDKTRKAPNFDEQENERKEFENMMFKSKRESMEANTKAEKEKAAKMKKERADLQLAMEEQARKNREADKRMKELEEKLRADMQAKDEAEQRQKEEEEQHRIELQDKEEQFKAEQAREAARAREREIEKAAIAADIAKERALYDQGSDDDDDEKKRRNKARLKVRKYAKSKQPDGRTGSVWTAAATDSIVMMKAYLMVQGTDKLIKDHNYEELEQGGRTLLHTACWYGCERVIALLLKLGADVNAYDSASTKITPLMEAARNNQAAAALMLLRHGARVRMEDCRGDNALHWAARRGHGTLISSMVQYAEKCDPGITRLLITARNAKGKEPLDLAKNGTVRGILERVIAECGGRDGIKNTKQLRRFKRGITKAQSITSQMKTLAVVTAQRRRYGRVRSHTTTEAQKRLSTPGKYQLAADKAVTDDVNLSSLKDLGLDLGLEDDGDFFKR